MNIGMIIGRIGGWDGVALEAEKWIEVLRSMGHLVFIASGQIQGRNPRAGTETLIPEMSFFARESVWSQKKAFFIPDADPDELTGHVRRYSRIIFEKLLKWTQDKQIEMLISENASSLPSQLEMGLAIHDLVRHTGLPTITHDHDFAWERGDRYHSPNRITGEFISGIFPLRAPNSIHAVINTHASNILQEKYGRTAVNVPNVMDFSKPFGIAGPWNAPLPEKLGFRNNDFLLFQLTSLVRRKKIETAIDLVHRLGDSRVKLVITGEYEDDAGSAYYHHLSTQVGDLGLSGQVRFASELFHMKGKVARGQKLFSLSDAYARATACTYFSSHEGFGNVVVEAILARRPLFVNNYEPVFADDISSKGIRTVMIEHGNLTDDAVEAMDAVIHHPAVAADMTEHNFELGRKYFSFETLREKLSELTTLAFKAAGVNK